MYSIIKITTFLITEALIAAVYVDVFIIMLIQLFNTILVWLINF